MLNTASASITLFGQDLYKKILNAIDQYTPYKLTYGNPIAQGFQNHADDIRYLDSKDPDIIEEIITDMGSQTGKTAAEIQEMTEEAIEQAVRKVDEVVEGSGIIIKTGDKTPKGKEFTEHAAEQATKRQYSLEDVDDIVENWTDKLYQPGGKTVYLKKQSYGYDDVIIDANGTSIISVIGGNAKRGVKNTLTSLDLVKRMLKNNGGWSTLPVH